MSTAPIAPRPNRRFWITVVAFAVANLAAWVAWDRCFARAHRGVLRVASVEPGDDAAVNPDATVRWRFDADVIPTDVYAKPPGRVVPAVAGRWAWESPRTLAFVPAVALPRATAVTFTLANDLIRTTTGAQLDHPVVTRVRSAPLAVKSVRQSAMLDDAYVIEMAFSDRVAPGDVLAHLIAKLPDGKGVRAPPVRPGRRHGRPLPHRPARRSPPTAPSAICSSTSPPAWLAPPVPSGSTSRTTRRFPLAHALAATGLTGDSPTRGQPSLTLAFNGEADTAALRQVLSVDPPVPFAVSSGYGGITLSGNFLPAARYTVKLADPPAGTPAADRNRYPRPGSISTFMPDVGSDCWFDADQGYLSTAGNRTLVAHVVNVDHLRVTATRVYDDNLVAWRNSAGRSGYDFAQETEPFARPAGDKRVDCPGAHNVRRDVRLSLDDLLSPLLARTGAWRISASSIVDHEADGDGPTVSGRASAVVTLSDVGLTAKRTRDGLVAWATSLRAATPLAGVRVRAYTDKDQLLGTATTDGDGLARLSGLHPAPGESVAVLLADTAPAEDGGPSELTWLDLRRSAWDLADLDTSGKPYLRTGHTAFVYADRGVYRPGETVRLRAVVRGPGDVAPTAVVPRPVALPPARPARLADRQRHARRRRRLRRRRPTARRPHHRPMVRRGLPRRRPRPPVRLRLVRRRGVRPQPPQGRPEARRRPALCDRR